MENINISKEILTKLAKLQEDVEYIKLHFKLKRDEDLEAEIKEWENASAEDTSNFLDKHDL